MPQAKKATTPVLCILGLRFLNHLLADRSAYLRCAGVRDWCYAPLEVRFVDTRFRLDSPDERKVDRLPHLSYYLYWHYISEAFKATWPRNLFFCTRLCRRPCYDSVGDIAATAKPNEYAITFLSAWTVGGKLHAISADPFA